MVVGFLGNKPRLLNKVKTIIGNEVVHWINQLQSFGIFPDRLRRLIGLVNQTYKGNVTISPHIRFEDLVNILKNPTPTYVKTACRYSELNTYNKIGLIKAIYEIEREISGCLKSIQSMLCIDDEIVDKISHDAPNSKIKLTTSMTHRENENGKGKGLNKSRSLAKDMNLYSLASRTQESGGVNGRDDRVKGLHRNSAHHQNSEKVKSRFGVFRKSDLAYSN